MRDMESMADYFSNNKIEVSLWEELVQDCWLACYKDKDEYVVENCRLNNEDYIKPIKFSCIEPCHCIIYYRLCTVPLIETAMEIK